MNLPGAVERFVAMFGPDGEHNPWKPRLGDKERFNAFKDLAKVRGARYVPATLDTYQTSNSEQVAVVSRLRAMQRDGIPNLHRGGGLLFYGPEGTGKDHLLFAMLRHAIIDCGYTATWRDGMGLQDEIRESIGDGGQSELRRRLCEPQIMAISDPLPPRAGQSDKDDLSAWNLQFLRDVIDRRYSALKSTWFTFNGTSLDALKAALLPPLTARIAADSTELLCSWRSNRKPARIPNE
jgi:DNA replication protein DnaC